MNTLLNSSAIQNSIICGLKRLNPKRLSRKYRDDEAGIAAIEFAIIAPVMIGMYFGLAEIATAISVDRRVSHATNVAGDLATQQTQLKEDDIEELVAAALRVIDVPNVTDVIIDIESFILPAVGEAPESQGRIVVNFTSRTTAFARYDPSNLDPELLSATSGIVVTRVKYQYTPIELRFFDSSITLEETFFLKPRRSDAVQIEDGPGSLVSCMAAHYSTVTCTLSGT